MRLYLDACSLIYAMEHAGSLRDAVINRMADALSAPTGILMTSRLSRIECRTKPLRESNARLLGLYDELFARARFRVVGVGAIIIEHATDLRARFNVRTPDAIHLATAIIEGADLFLTGDKSLARCTDVPIELL